MFFKDIPDYWSPEQALTIVEFLDDLRDRIYDQYELRIRELQRDQSSSDETGWDEDVPF